MQSRQTEPHQKQQILSADTTAAVSFSQGQKVKGKGEKEQRCVVPSLLAKLIDALMTV